jgi:hypothetical protein
MSVEQPSQAGEQPTPPPAAPTIHEAFLGSGGAGFVEYGAEIDFTTAVLRRQTGEDVVVRGEDINANRRLAEQIEKAVGPCQRQVPPIRSAGPHALPHYQQTRRKPPGPVGHTFYETAQRKARRKR